MPSMNPNKAATTTDPCGCGCGYVAMAAIIAIARKDRNAFVSLMCIAEFLCLHVHQAFTASRHSPVHFSAYDLIVIANPLHWCLFQHGLFKVILEYPRQMYAVV